MELVVKIWGFSFFLINKLGPFFPTKSPLYVSKSYFVRLKICENSPQKKDTRISLNEFESIALNSVTKVSNW